MEMVKGFMVSHPVKLLFCLFLIGGNAQSQVMKYVSSKAERITGNVVQESGAVPVQRLVIYTTGTSTPLSLTKLELKTKRKKVSADIRIFSTGKDSLFSDRQPVEQLHQKGQTLREGANYFWICVRGKENISGRKNEALGVTSFELGVQAYQEVWADEFNDSAINKKNWSFEQGFVRNREHQWYSEENASTANGILTIEARKEKRENPGYLAGSADWRKSREFIEYTSGSMRTAGKQEWQYGRFEMRARIDTVAGYWPAWWTLGVEKRWPLNGEIDIMEFYKGQLLFNIAVGSSKPGNAHWFSVTKPVSSFPDPHWVDRFHTWRMDWDEEGIGLYLDDVLLNYQPQSVLYNRDNSGFYPFKQKQYMLLNLAIGGDNGGNPAQTSFPRKYEVDYVRVAQKVEGKFKHVGTYKPQQVAVKNISN